MKKLRMLLGVIITVILCINVISISGSAQGIIIDDANFPDEVFRNYVSSEFDTDNDGQLSESEIAEIKRIDVNRLGVKDLTGLECFTSLESLFCQRNTGLTTLNIENAVELKVLDCVGTGITSLDLSKNLNLTELYCHENNITSLDLSVNVLLKRLNISYCPISLIDLSNNPKLESLYATGCEFKEIDLSPIENLENLNVNDNHLSRLDLEPFATMGYATPGNQVRDIVVAETSFDMSVLGDVSKMSDITGGTLDGNVLVLDGSPTVTYKYFTGNSEDYMNVTLNVSVIAHNEDNSIEYNDNTHWNGCSYDDCVIRHNETAHNHDIEIVDTAYWASNANCLEPAKIYKLCSCGHVGNETFDYGTTTRHLDKDGDGNCDNCDGAPESNLNPAMTFDINIIFDFLKKLFSFVGGFAG